MLKARLLGLSMLALLFTILIPAGHVFAATHSSLQPHDGTTYFLLNNSLNFSSASGTGNDNGATIQLDQNTVENGVISYFQHALFFVDGSGNVTVYTSGNSPTAVQTSVNSDNSVNMQYSQSSNSYTDSFNGTLAGDQMTATYDQQTFGGTTVGGQQYTGGTDISATFTTTVNWVSADQIPGAPSGGQYQLSSDGGVILSWGAASGNVAGYNIYRMIFTVDNQPQLIATTTDVSYTDESPEAIQNAQTITGMMYEVYAVGPTGIENPADVLYSVSSL